MALAHLRDRITRLQRQTGRDSDASRSDGAPSAAEPGMLSACAQSLRQQLRGLESTRAHQGRDRSGLTDQELAVRLQGECVAPGLVLIERALPFGTSQGRETLDKRALHAFVFFAPGTLPRPGEVVFLDTETTGLAGGTGTVAFLVGLATLTATGFRISQYLLTSFAGECALLEQVHVRLRQALSVVTYNGKSFDSPLLSTRSQLACLVNPLSELQHVDLLHLARRAYGGRWPDCRLPTAEDRLLGFVRCDDLPSRAVPEAWFRWMRYGKADQLPQIVHHNRFDLMSLVALLHPLQRCYSDPLAYEANVVPIMRHVTRAPQAFHYLYARRRALDDAGLLELARLARSRGEWGLALTIWQDLSLREHTQATEELAKYFEHQARDYRYALTLTQQLRNRLPDNAAYRHREIRLSTKLTVRRQTRGST